MPKPLKLHSETFYQWAIRQFEFEYCDECCKGVQGHYPGILFGHWFAVCKSPPPEPF